MRHTDAHRTRTKTRHHIGAPLTWAAVLSALCSCAPAAAPAGGEIGDQVQQALDSGTESFEHAAWDQLLAEGTRNGLVDYGFMAAHREQLDAYLARIAQAPLYRLSRDHLMALLINAYNAYTVASILDHPGVRSIRDIDGVWSEIEHTVGGFAVTLDTIEHNLLRPYFRDPRVHVAVNCASMSCAPLPGWALDGDDLDQQLQALTAAFFSNTAYVRIEDDRLWVSKLLDWYGEDFVNPEFSPHATSVAQFVARFATPEVRAFIERNVQQHDGDPSLSFLDYDWSLNRAPASTAD